jgi:hypothetical protein
MNTWTDSGLSEAGMIGAMLAIGVEARLPEGPARPGRGGSRRADAARRTGPARGSDVARDSDWPDEVPDRGGRRRADEREVHVPSVQPGLAALGVPAADYEDSEADSRSDSQADLYSGSGSHSSGSHSSGSHSAVEPAAPAPVTAAASSASSHLTGPSSLTGSFPLSGVARLQTPESVPLPSEPLPPEPAIAPASPVAAPASSSVPPAGDRDALHSSTDGFLAGGFSSSSDSAWELGGGSGELSGDLGGPWSRPVPITPAGLDSGLHAAVSAPTTMVREPLSPAVSAPTSLLPMPKTPASHRAGSTGSTFGRHADFGSDLGSDLGSDPSSGRDDDARDLRESDLRDSDAGGAGSSREAFTVESSTLGSLDSSDLFAALSRRGR